MGIVDLIKKKAKGQALTEDEIARFVEGIVDGTVSEAQIGAMLMAIKWKELDKKETRCLTRCMVNSGDVLTWPDKWRGSMVDKHSTGGVGDKISLVLVPILACCDVKVPMVSGRGLDHTGGTLDKLEAIPGVSVEFDIDSIKSMVEDIGCCIVGQTESLVPADKQLYAIRDVTDTVDNNSLIASSVVSKKASENVDFLILDVKCGKAAVIQDEAAAEVLGKLMVDISNDIGMRTMALLTRMDHPIGLAIGNSLEVVESLRCLRWNCPVCSDSKKCLHCRGCHDILALVYELGGRLLCSAGKTQTLVESRCLMEEKIRNGEAMNCFKKLIVAQGAKQEVAECLCDPKTDFWAGLPKALHSKGLKVEQDGVEKNKD
ncbi:thymidine phosphorylase-like isoform X2 [Mizuhopecten yessoensis]|uniref:thymidine phosphorylase-like isoform X2 n=1 Tax=Mizuhopecten yessoensis TaxID=6573 RepID=UPI000B45DCED|nr:thymidine phosphorylase-like isoform X2 [Mizuhopecten yessoensis]